uniref:Solute carrier family 66 member 1 like n=1 Tax=Gorilla gorilla gorilla TaxID=9595 RepID=A0A2I2YSZ2_GORGO
MKVMGSNRVNTANSSTDKSRENLTCRRSQLFVAYRNGRVDEAVSLGFLVCWIGGDLTNFKGCYLTNQLPIQDIPTSVIQRLHHQRESQIVTLGSPLPCIYPTFFQISEISIPGYYSCLCHTTINTSKRRFILM